MTAVVESPATAVVERLSAQLRVALGPDRVLTDPAQLRTYECDGLANFRVSPGVVVLAESRQDVVETVRLCAEHGVPYVARGSGTGLSGGALPVADGVLMSTALGSTGYNFSAGGPACHPTLAMMSVTPICAHHPRLPPFVLPKASVVAVDVHPSPYRPVRVSADGRQIEDVRRLVVRFADREVRLAYLDGHDFTGRMLRKILHP